MKRSNVRGAKGSVEERDANGKVISEKYVWIGDGGRKGYLRWLAVYHPAQFAPMLARILPLQINARSEKLVEVTYRTAEEVTQELKEAGFTDEKIDLLLEDLRPSSAPVPLDDGSNDEENDEGS